MALLNYRTKIEPEQTIGEIQKMLSRHGVMAMMTEYDGRHVSAVAFKMNVNGTPMSFRLPCDWRGVLEVFKDDKNARKRGCVNQEQASRTAWRIIHEWIGAQLALIEVNMATIPQVFLPYAVTKSGATLYEHMIKNPGLLLGDGK